jgi:hypothetical protein
VLPAIVLRTGPNTHTEPPLRCFMRADRADPDARGRLPAGATIAAAAAA